MILTSSFFNREPCTVARELLGKVLRHKYQGRWLACRITETEAYYMDEKASHSSLGYTQKRRAMFMPAGTIYMYYARGGDSLNISVKGEGNAVLIKAGVPWQDNKSPAGNIALMQALNPVQGSGRIRKPEKLCAGQTLLCRALNIKVARWDARAFDPGFFYIEDIGELPSGIIQTTRLGIPKGRDEHLMYRFIDHDHAGSATQNPLRKRNAIEGIDFRLIKPTAQQ